MRRTLFHIVGLLLLSLPSGAQDSIRAYAVGDVPNVRLADSRQYVSDPNNILSTQAKDSINATLGRLESETGIETAVVMLPSIGEDDPFGFSMTLFRQWGIGKKKSDNGLLILFVGDQRQVHFTTGYGIEGSLPDITCKRIQTRYMIPAFKEGDYDTGMTLGVKAVYAELKDAMRPDKDAEDGFSAWNYAFLIFAILLCVFVPTYLDSRKRKCPHCGKRTLRKISSKTFKDKRGHIIRRDAYVCDSCGHIVNDDNDLGDGNNNMDALTDAMIIGSMFGHGRGGGFSGGGFSGGHFGGGSSGGGGAGSGW